jgi:predicted esterase
MGQAPSEEHRSEPVLLWHKASALFPVRVHLPEGFDSTRTYPTVIALHGYGSSSEQFARVGRAFARAGFLTVVPQGPYPVPLADSAAHATWQLSTWLSDLGVGPNLTDDLAIETQSSGITALEFLPSVLDRIQEQYRVGPVYTFGFSLGGVFALGSAFYNSDRFDGVIAFGIGKGIDRKMFTMQGGSLEDGSQLKVRLVLGRSDRLVPFSEAERLRDLLKTAGYDVTLDAFDGGHEVPDEALKRAVTWLSDLTRQ